MEWHSSIPSSMQASSLKISTRAHMLKGSIHSQCNICSFLIMALGLVEFPAANRVIIETRYLRSQLAPSIQKLFLGFPT